MSKEFDSVNRKIEIKGFPKKIKKEIGRMVQKDRIEEAEQIQRDYVNRKPDKGFDLYCVEIRQSSKSKRKEVRNIKAGGDEEAKKEAKKVWEDDKNRPDYIRSRIDGYFNNILGCYPKEKKALEEILTYPDDKAREEIAKYEGVPPEERKEKLDKVEFLRNRFSEKEKATDQNEKTYKTLGIFRWFFLLDRVYKEDLENFFNVDGAGKTILDKVISGVRQKIVQKKK